MVVALWVIAVVACCVLCGWGIATAVRRSKERRTRAAVHNSPRASRAAVSRGRMRPGADHPKKMR